MIAKILFLFVMFSNAITGYVSGYHQTPTDATLEYRIAEGYVFQHQYNIAVLDCGQLGNEAMIIFGEEIIMVNVFDCAGIEDGGHSWMIENNIVLEMGWYLWQDHPELLYQKVDLVIMERR